MAMGTLFVQRGKIAGTSVLPVWQFLRSRVPPELTPVTPDDLVAAIGALGGEATVEQLVETLGLPDGRSLNGARRVAVEAGTVAYEDRTYRLAG